MSLHCERKLDLFGHNVYFMLINKKLFGFLCRVRNINKSFQLVKYQMETRNVAVSIRIYFRLK